MQYIDLTQTFDDHMPVFPGDSPPELVKSVDGDITHYQIKTGMHVGTHMDAPLHMVPGGKYLNEYPAEKFFGRGILIDARGRASADADLLDGRGIRAGDIALVCFGWDKKFSRPDYFENYPELTEGFANKLVELGVSIIGMDTSGPDSAPYKIHKILLPHDVLIIENLTNLTSLIGKKDFEVIALPTKFQTEAAPCRVVAKFE